MPTQPHILSPLYVLSGIYNGFYAFVPPPTHSLYLVSCYCYKQTNCFKTDEDKFIFIVFFFAFAPNSASFIWLSRWSVHQSRKLTSDNQFSTRDHLLIPPDFWINSERQMTIVHNVQDQMTPRNITSSKNWISYTWITNKLSPYQANRQKKQWLINQICLRPFFYIFGMSPTLFKMGKKCQRLGIFEYVIESSETHNKRIKNKQKTVHKMHGKHMYKLSRLYPWIYANKHKLRKPLIQLHLVYLAHDNLYFTHGKH